MYSMCLAVSQEKVYLCNWWDQMQLYNIHILKIQIFIKIASMQIGFFNLGLFVLVSYQTSTVTCFLAFKKFFIYLFT